MKKQQKNRSQAKKIAKSLSSSLSDIFIIPQGSTSSSGNESSDQQSQTSTEEVEGVDPGSEDNATQADKDLQKQQNKEKIEDGLEFRHSQALQSCSRSQHVRYDVKDGVISTTNFNQEA